MSNVVLKCTSSTGSWVLKGLTSESTVEQLQSNVEQVTQITPPYQKIRSGFPPKSLCLDSSTALISTLGIRSGDTLHVEKSAQPNNNCNSNNGSQAPNNGSQAPNNGSQAPNSQQTSNPTCRRGIARKVVPANNSCLFASLGFTLQGDAGDSIATALRYLVGDAIVNNPTEYSEVILGKPPQEYAKWIQNPAIWGGGIELAILSKHFNTEIHVVDTQSLRIDKFGQDLKCTDKTFIIYDGIHYDPLYDPASRETVFPVGDEEVERAAMLLASNARKAHNYTDLANFTLKCGTCGTGLAGERDARAHAKQTGHTNFQEYQ